MLGLTRFRAVKVDKVQPDCAIDGKLTSDGYGVVKVDRLLCIVALSQPYTSTSPEINRRKEYQEPRFPLVELESLRSDCRVAWCNAIPNALNVASHTWWSFSPEILRRWSVIPEFTASALKNSLTFSVDKSPIFSLENGMS